MKFVLIIEENKRGDIHIQASAIGYAAATQREKDYSDKVAAAMKTILPEIAKENGSAGAIVCEGDQRRN